MTVGLNADLMNRLVKAEGTVEDFIAKWQETYPDQSPPTRATIYRWCEGGLCKSEDLLLRLASVVDLDPFALLSIPDSLAPKLAEKALIFFESTGAGKHPLQIIRRFFGRRSVWPPNDMASTYFRRPWVTEDFLHDPSVDANFYAGILLRRTGTAPLDRPQVFHFAFRSPGSFGNRWLHYGFVQAEGLSIVLRHINGFVDRSALARPDQAIRVETWFGPGPVEFRIASLHAFSFELIGRHEDAEKWVRFPA